MSDEGTGQLLSGRISEFERLIKDLEIEAHKSFNNAIRLIGFGLLLVILLPYILIFIDDLLAPLPSEIETKEKIQKFDEEISKIILAIPPIIWQDKGGFTDDWLTQPVFTDEGVGVIVGDKGALLISVDGGKNWIPQNSGTGQWLQPPVYTDKRVGVIVGDKGALLVSVDGGKKWTPQNSGVGGELRPPVYSEKGIGVIVGDDTPSSGYGTKSVILISIDGGKTWKQNSSGINAYIYPPVFTDKGVGIIIGNEGGHILISLDYGKNWKVQDYDTVRIHPPVFTDKGVGVIASDTAGDDVEAEFLISTNGGKTWRKQFIGTYESFSPPIYSNKGVGVSLGSESILISLDGGKNWKIWENRSYSITLGTFRKVVFTDEGVGIIVGNDGTLLISINGGQSWSKRDTRTNDDLKPPVFSSSNVGVIVSIGGTLLLSIDAGRNWENVNSGTRSNLTRPVFTDNHVGVIVGDTGDLLVSIDDGRSWTIQDSGTKSSLKPPVFLNEDYGVIVGTAGTLLVTIDGGKNWTLQDSDTGGTLSSPVVTNNGVAVIVGSGGALLVSSNFSTPFLSKEYSPLIHIIKNSIYKTTGKKLEGLSLLKKMSKDLLLTEQTKKKLKGDRLTEKYVTRAASLGVILFLIQVLITNYRYNRKLATFYFSRVQALKIRRDLYQESSEVPDISILMSALTPDTDFGKNAQTPLDAVASLAQKLSSSKRG